MEQINKRKFFQILVIRKCDTRIPNLNIIIVYFRCLKPITCDFLYKRKRLTLKNQISEGVSVSSPKFGILQKGPYFWLIQKGTQKHSWHN